MNLREQLLKWSGYKYRKDIDLWWRQESKVLIRHWESGKWSAYLWAEKGKKNQWLCDIESFGRLILLCLAIDGDENPLIIKPRKK